MPLSLLSAFFALQRFSLSLSLSFSLFLSLSLSFSLSPSLSPSLSLFPYLLCSLFSGSHSRRKNSLFEFSCRINCLSFPTCTRACCCLCWFVVVVVVRRHHRILIFFSMPSGSIFPGECFFFFLSPIKRFFYVLILWDTFFVGYIHISIFSFSSSLHRQRS